MRIKKNLMNMFLVIIFMAGFFLIDLHIATSQEDVVVIINKSAPQLTNLQIKRIFTGVIDKWPNGRPIKVLLNKDINLTKRFCNKYLNMNPRRLNSYWMKKGIREGIPAPRKVSTNVLLTMIEHSYLFISFIKSSEAIENVKVLK